MAQSKGKSTPGYFEWSNEEISFRAAKALKTLALVILPAPRMANRNHSSEQILMAMA